MTLDDGDEPTKPCLTAREVAQVLREVVFGRSTMNRSCVQTWDEIYAGYFHVNVNGWHISIYIDCGDLDYCEECVATDGRRWVFDSGNRFGTDPIALLSNWEHGTLEQLLRTI
jgi:hypothetical protein